MGVNVIAGPVTVRAAHRGEQTSQTRPIFLDFPYTFAKGGQGFITAQRTASTTLAAAPQAGATQITVADGTSLVAGQLLTIVNTAASPPAAWPITWQNVMVTSVAGNVVTLTDKLIYDAAIGDTVYPTWTNDTHIGPFWGNLVSWLLDARIAGSGPGGTNLIPNATANFTTWSGGAAAIPDGWTAIGATTFARTQYLTSEAPANARQNAANASQFGVQMTGLATDGMYLTTPIPVVPGQRYTFAPMVRINSTGVYQVQVVDATTPTTIIGSLTVDQNRANHNLYRVPLKVTIPAGTTSVRLQILANGSYVSDVRFVASRQDSTSDLRVIRDPGPYSIAFLGDSWGRGMIDSGGLQAALNARFGRTITLVDSCTSGNTLATQLTRLDALLQGTPPAYLVHASTFMNDTGVAAATLQSQVQTLITKCRDVGTVPIILGVGNRNSVLATALALNESIRATIDAEIGSLILTDSNVATLGG